MNRVITSLLLAVGLASSSAGCAHNSTMSRSHVAQAALTAAVIGGVVLMATTYNCANCNIGTEPQGARP